ncbi:MAG: phosphoribosyltransferase [Nitrososphaerota archaeon]
MIFQNRQHAGCLLAERLIHYRNLPGGIILALPRGGVAVGYQLSLGLHLPLDVFIARKIGAPDNPEYAIGAVGELGEIYWNPVARAAYHLRPADIERLIRSQQDEIARRQALYRQNRPLPRLENRTVILVDDGIATGSTFFAAIHSIRQRGPRRLVGAIPVGPRDTLQQVEEQVDELAVLAMPDPFWAVGNHYADFSQVSDREVVDYLDRAEESLREHTRLSS